MGRIFGKQSLWISAGCGLGGAIHELGHVLGFWHEQSRPDRDTYVTILWENIVTGKEDQFQKYSHMLVDSREVDYDYDSVMHYSAYVRSCMQTFSEAQVISLNVQYFFLFNFRLTLAMVSQLLKQSKKGPRLDSVMSQVTLTLSK